MLDVEPKDYLFQTMIDISNHPDVKNLFEQFEDGLVKYDINNNVYRKIFFRNPRLLHQLIFTKPSMSQKYLNFVYNQGIKIINIIGEEEVFKIMESIKVTNPKFFDELSNAIEKDEVLNDKIETLRILNSIMVEKTLYESYPILCLILMFSFIPLVIITGLLNIFWIILYEILHDIFPVYIIVFIQATYNEIVIAIMFYSWSFLCF